MKWGETLSGPPQSSGCLAGSVLVRRWRGVCPDIEQPPLDHHYITLHLGGAKKIRRKGDGSALHNDIADGAYSVTPAGSAFSWRTEGPVDFAHVYVSTKSIDQMISAEFDREARCVVVHDALGARDPLLEALLLTFEAGVSGKEIAGRLFWEGCVHTFMHRLLKTHSTVATTRAGARSSLAPYRVRRALEFIETHLPNDIGLDDLAAAAGVSAFHFSRGFRRATGRSPYAFLIHRRIECAKSLLLETDAELATIALDCGFGSHSQFSTLFKRATGFSPTRYRNQQ